MRKSGLVLALAASAQLTVFSSPAFADDTASAGASVSTSAGGSSSSASSSGTADSSKSSTGWIILGIGGAATITGIVLDIVGANSGSVSGQGGPGDSGTTSNARTNLYWGGTALIVAGVVTGIVGGSMIVNANKGSDTTPSTPPTRDEEDASRGGADAVSKVASASLKSAPTFVVPVLGARF
jgi:hypothetical protein